MSGHPGHRKPTWSERYRLGVEMNKHLDTVCTLEELGAELGLTKQNAYTESVLALGSFVWELRERLMPPNSRPARTGSSA